MRPVLVFALAIMLSPCANDDERYKAIKGEWNAAEWLVTGKPSNKNIQDIRFHFNEDNTYRSQLGASAEKGTFRIQGDYLYTKAENRLEIMVKIRKLTNDSLVLDMNNSGQEETLILIREQ